MDVFEPSLKLTISVASRARVRARLVIAVGPDRQIDVRWRDWNSRTLEYAMTFGDALDSMLRRAGYSIVSEFVTPDQRSAVRLRALTSPAVIVMFHSDAVELARGAVTVSAIARRNRSVFGADAVTRSDDPISWRQ